MVNVSVMRDDLLNDRRANFRLRRWWRRRWRWGWGWRRSGSAFLLAPDDDLVPDDFARVGGWRLLTRTADDELLTLTSDQVTTIASRRRETPLATSNRQGAPFSAGVSSITTELSAVGTDFKIAVSLLEADGASFSRDVPAVAAHFTARSMEVDAITTAAASEAHLVPLRLALWWAAGRRTVSTAEDNVFTFDLAELGLSGTRLLAASDGDIRLICLDLAGAAASRSIAVADVDVVPAPHAGGGRGWTGAANRARVVESGRTAGASGELVVSRADHHLPGRVGAVVVVVQEVGHTAPGVAATASTQLDIELLIVALAAIAAAVEIALALLIQLGGRVASRHGVGEQQQVTGSGGW